MTEQISVAVVATFSEETNELLACDRLSGDLELDQQSERSRTFESVDEQTLLPSTSTSTSSYKFNFRREVPNLLIKSSLLLAILLLVSIVTPKDLKLLVAADAAATIESLGQAKDNGNLALRYFDSSSETEKKLDAPRATSESNSIHTERHFEQSTGAALASKAIGRSKRSSSIRVDLTNGNDQLESEDNDDDAPTEATDQRHTHRRAHQSNGHQIAASPSEPEAEVERELRASAEDASDPLAASAADERENVATGNGASGQPAGKLHVVRILAPEAVQNGTQNVTIDCMFKFDRKLDERLTIKWFFNDEVEPIYQWIPELNKRVYSDKYERFLDKSYQVNEDVDFMLEAYKWLTSSSPHSSSEGATSGSGGGGGDSTLDNAEDAHLTAATGGINGRQLGEESRRILASKLNKLANLGGRHSRQLIESLRSTLAMDLAEFSRFRALRLLAPTTELSGRFTCSVSSLDGEDLRSSKLVVYEPAKSFNFNVTRVAGSPNQYRLACRAAHAFPRPSLSLYRYRAGPASLELRGRPVPGYPSHHRQASSRPRLAATQLRQELIPGTQTQLTVSGMGDLANPQIQPLATGGGGDSTSNDIATAIESMTPNQGDEMPTGRPTTGHVAYEISAWVLVDEASLSSNLVTQFECHLSIEGTNYEQRQSLALQRGWHVNPAALTATRYTLVVGLLTALASLLCLMLALIKFLMIQRKLRQRATMGDLTQHHRQQSSIGSRRMTPTSTTSGISITGTK